MNIAHINQPWPLNPLIAADKNDIVYLPKFSQPRKDLRNGYQELYKSMGFSTETRKIKNGDMIRIILGEPEELNFLKEKKFTISPYYLSPALEEIIQKEIPCTPSLIPARKYQSKTTAKKLAESLGIPTLPTLQVHQLPEGQFVIKEDLGLGGINTKLLTKEELMKLDIKVPHLIEPYLEDCPSICSLFHIGDKVEEIGTTEQIIKNRFQYRGTIYPSSSMGKAPEYARKIAEALAKEGYKGHLGIDFLISDQTYFLEINPRLNCSTYPLMFMNATGAKSIISCFFVIKNFITAEQFAEMTGKQLYNPETTKGIIPYNICFDEKNKTIGALILSDSKEESMKGYELARGMLDDK